MNKNLFDFFADKFFYEFKSEELMTDCITHPSYDGNTVFERLEYLGDAVLELTVSDWLYRLYENESEGFLTKKRAGIVCGSSLASMAVKIGLNDVIRLGKGEVKCNGKNKSSILENAFEAVIGAIFLDSDFNTAKDVVVNIFSRNEFTGAQDYKSELMELVQSDGKRHLIDYREKSRKGPSHELEFEIELYIDGKFMASAREGSKKKAEQNAACAALDILNK